MAVELLILKGRLYKRYNLAAFPDGQWVQPPDGWIPAGEKPPNGHPYPGWLPVGMGPNDARIRTAYRRLLRECEARVIARENGKRTGLEIGRSVTNGRYELRSGKMIRVGQVSIASDWNKATVSENDNR